VGFESAWAAVPDGPDGQVAFQRAKDGFELGELNALAPELAGSLPLRLVGPVATGGESQGVPNPTANSGAGRSFIPDVPFLVPVSYLVFLRGSSSGRTKLVSRGPMPCPSTMVSLLQTAK
jgi:hypothetical protein